MAKRMLIDATHPEETRVVVLNGTRLEEFDFETSTKRQIKGNIYLAKVTRVEPSLQAAFVEYGGNRHGFLAFSEIHPDYYRIPVSDREAMAADERSSRSASDRARSDDALTENGDQPLPPDTEEGSSSEAAGHKDLSQQEGDLPRELSEEADEKAPDYASPTYPSIAESMSGSVLYAPPDIASHDDSLDYPGTDQPDAGQPDTGQPDTGQPDTGYDEAPGQQAAMEPYDAIAPQAEVAAESAAEHPGSEPAANATDETSESFLPQRDDDPGAETSQDGDAADAPNAEPDQPGESRNDQEDTGFVESRQVVETLGGDEIEEDQQQPRHYHHHRHYKVQEVIKRRQILLIQVTKEERGNKGAALTTYLSLAGRYCVLMPNAGRGGGVSRKITSAADRRRLKDLMEELQVPEGMGVIVRTAGSERSKAEIHRDYEYLLRLWDEIRELTLRSSAPALIYEEGNLIKRAIRDLYSRDIDEILVEGEEGYRTARSFMKMLMPSHASQVKPYRDPIVPLFHRFQVDTQIDQIHNPVVQLRSGGYVVINPTEALVAIDVNSGRSTRERNIEETATKTNLEAADEIARQLRLRDLAGLIVIDFIDMEEGRNQSAVERRLKDAMRNDRARIQIGRISPFGLLELSRQRLRSSLIEASTQPCPHCNGTGAIRSTESAALVVLRALEEEGIRRRTAEITILIHSHVALYILNQKRDLLSAIEQRYGFHVTIDRDDTLILPAYRLDRMRALSPAEITALDAAEPPPLPEDDFQDETGEFEDGEFGDEAETGETAETGAGETQADGQTRRKKRRRKRRRSGDDRGGTGAQGFDSAANTSGAFDEGAEGEDGQTEEFEETERAEDSADSTGMPGTSAGHSDEFERRPRRRGRRGGRRRHSDEGTAPASDLGYPPPTDFARDGREALFGDDETDDQPSSQPVADPPLTGQPPSAEDEQNTKPDAAEPAVLPADDASPVVDSGAPDPEAAIAAGVTDPDSAPARRPRPARRKKPDGEAEPAAQAKPRRTRRPRSTTAEDVLAEEQPDAAPLFAAEASIETPAPVIVAEPPPEPVIETVQEPEPPKEEAPAGPKRSGWWRRLVQ